MQPTEQLPEWLIYIMIFGAGIITGVCLCIASLMTGTNKAGPGRARAPRGNKIVPTKAIKTALKTYNPN
jgi:hypothetical protein